MRPTTALFMGMLLLPMLVRPGAATPAAQRGIDCSAGLGTRSRMPLVNNIWIDVPEGWRALPRPNTLGPGPVSGVLAPQGATPAQATQVCGLVWIAVPASEQVDAAEEFSRLYRDNPQVREVSASGRADIDRVLAALVRESADTKWWQNKVLEPASASVVGHDGIRGDVAFFRAGQTFYLLVFRSPEQAGAVRARFLEMLASITPLSSHKPAEKTAPTGPPTLTGRWTTQGAAITITATAPGQYWFEETYIIGPGQESSRSRGTLTSLGTGRIRRTTISALGEKSETCDYELSRDDAGERDRLMLCTQGWVSVW